MNLFHDEEERHQLFPVTRSKLFFAHAAVTALPACVADAMCAHAKQSCEMPQEFDAVLHDIKEARRLCADFIEARAEEIALLGPTSLGLSLFANGLPWQAGDEVLCYMDDYPANVYPWLELRRRGVVVNFLKPQNPGEITLELVERSLTPKTKLVALASCHFFTGYRIDVDAIGSLLQERGVLFSLDAIQTLGAFPTSMEHVDFMSADAHKWMLGPLSIGIVYVKKAHFERCRPTLLGAWNVHSPNFIAQDELRFVPTAQRYEPGVLNITGIYGMIAAIRMFQRYGMDVIAHRILELKSYLVAGLRELGFQILGPVSGDHASGITTFRHEKWSMEQIYQRLEKEHVVCSLRHDRHGLDYLRLCPHFYNTEAEIDTVLQLLV
jgi:cysteine desulfurase / selenocysteine lyase